MLHICNDSRVDQSTEQMCMYAQGITAENELHVGY